jgi:tripartite-type tricarboxylate transporter receptor subunit TctC
MDTRTPPWVQPCSRPGPRSTPVARGRRALLGALLAAPAIAARADEARPDEQRPVRLVVPFPPGGGADALGRILEPALASRLGRRVLVVNQGGAGGTIGAASVARAPADGLTLLLGTNSTHGMATHLIAGLPYDPSRDFTPIGPVVDSPIALFAGKLVDRPTPEAWFAALRATGRQVTYATSGNGTPHHLAGVALQQRTGIPFVHVPYRGAAPALTDLIGGQVDAAILGLPGAIAQVRAGRIAAIAVTSPKRSPLAPDVPALAETLPGFSVRAWYGMFAPPGLAPAVRDRAASALRATLADPDIRERLTSAGFDVADGGPDTLAEAVAAEVEQSGRLVKAAGLSATRP